MHGSVAALAGDGEWQKRHGSSENCHHERVHRVVALAVPQVVAFDLGIPAMVFDHPDWRGRYTFRTATECPGPVPTTTGFSLLVEEGLEAVAEADTVVVPGYEAPGGVSPDVCEALRAAAGGGARIVSVCTGAFALAAAGLLDGRRATTHWMHAADLARLHPTVDVDPDVLYVAEPPVMTSAGVAAGIDLCLHLVRLDHGAEVAAQVARRMVVAPHRDGGQAQFIRRPPSRAASRAPGLAATCDWAVARLHEPLTVADLAAHAGWSPRTLARRFVDELGTTPLRWLAAQRVLEARRLLESTDLPVDVVARRCGLGSAANLRLHLARDAATTPTAYRRAFRGSAVAVS
jgi:AraC family transcriptional activator FtrA